MKQCNHCDVKTDKRECDRVTQLDVASCNIEIKAEALARLIQTNQLTINDFKCEDVHTKQFVQAVMLNCIVCRSSADLEDVQSVCEGKYLAR